MPDYNKGRIYTIRHITDNNLIYVGSTCEELSKRMGCHRYTSKKHNNNFFFKTVAENGGWPMFYIELYELYPCNSKDELNKREGEVQRDIATLNTRIENRTGQKLKYEETQRCMSMRRDKIYYERQAEIQAIDKRHDKELQSIYKRRVKELTKTKENVKEYQRRYREANQDKIKEYHRRYREANKQNSDKNYQI